MHHQFVVAQETFDCIVEGRLNFLMVQSEDIQSRDTITLERDLYPSGVTTEVEVSYVLTQPLNTGLLSGWCVAAIRPKR
jgi:hypothetical protein